MARHEFQFAVEARETRVIDFSLYEEDGTTQFGAAATDQVRFKLWQTNDAIPNPDLGDTANSQGSSAKITNVGQQGVTPAVATVTLAQDDTAALPPGWYHATLGFIDDSATSPADAYSVVARGRIQILGSATGDRGKAS